MPAAMITCCTWAPPQSISRILLPGRALDSDDKRAQAWLGFSVSCFFQAFVSGLFISLVVVERQGFTSAWCSPGYIWGPCM